ncbi:MAG: hypothetical protein GX417_11165 [Clostridiales bacterium]|nr:hypothetical protein [Clostridiales bacterium]
MKRIKAAGVLMLIHGIFEVFGFVGVMLADLTASVNIGDYMHFIVPYFNSNLVLLNVCSLIYGALRIIAAKGLFSNRKWGLELSIILSVITLTLMMFVLPAGIMDGLLSGAVLLLLLMAKEQRKEIIT